jgi:pimeloyl-ACP methyl ester carboxylesterase
MQMDTSLLIQLRMPVLIMWGAKDQWIPVEQATRFSALLPQDTVVIYEALGHVPMEEDPLTTVAVVKAFLD